MNILMLPFALLLFLVIVTACSLWLCGAVFMWRDHNMALGIIGFIVPPVGFLYGAWQLVVSPNKPL